jgi:hypothetical protein
MKAINARDIKWVKGKGYGMAERLFGSWQTPNTFKVLSPKSNNTKTFILDENAPGYEDGWDGELKMFVSTCGTIKLIVSHE